LLAAARGEAPAAVTAHLRRCAACRATVAEYQRIERLLVSRLDRRSCPDTLTIGEYAADLLPPAERQHVAEHLVACPRCAEERRVFSSFLSEESDPPVRERITATLRRVLLLPLAPAAGLAGLRGAGSAQSRTFTAEGVQLQLSVEPGAPGAGATITGMFIEGGEDATGAPASLIRENAAAASQPVDDLGSFLFAGVRRGDYRIEIETADSLLVLDALTVP
jgi:anti-sigma factor RsiW